MGVFLFSVYYILLPMASRCTCCHICHTSVKTSRRTFFPCSSCPSIICRQCIEGNGEDWNEINESSCWDCPRCRDACPCKRCRNRVNSPSPKSYSPAKTVKRSLDEIDNHDDSSPERKKPKLESQVISGLGLTNPTANRTLATLTQAAPEPNGPISRV